MGNLEIIIASAVAVVLLVLALFFFHRYREHIEHERAEREWAMGKLREGKELLRTVVDSTKEAMISIGEDGLIILFNTAAEEMFGRTRKEMTGQPLDSLMPKDYRKQHRQSVSSYFETGKPDSAIGKIVELSGLRSDGSVFPMEISLSKGRHEGHQFVIAVARDITERKRMEDALHKSEERFQQVAENAQVWIWEVDAEGLYTYASPAVEQILGYKPEEVVGTKHFYDFFRAAGREEQKKAAFEVFSKKLPFRDFQNLNVHKNGSGVWLSTSAVPVLDEDGNSLGYRGSDTDITEHKRMEEKLRKSEQN